jgi:hypothetical protein
VTEVVEEDEEVTEEVVAEVVEEVVAEVVEVAAAGDTVTAASNCHTFARNHKLVFLQHCGPS